MKINGVPLALSFRRLTVGDRTRNSAQFGATEKFQERLSNLDMGVISTVLYRQLEKDCKDELVQFKDCWLDEDENGKEVDGNLTKFQIFVRLPLFQDLKALLDLILILSGVSPDDALKRVNDELKKKAALEQGPNPSTGP